MHQIGLVLHSHVVSFLHFIFLILHHCTAFLQSSLQGRCTKEEHWDIIYFYTYIYIDGTLQPSFNHPISLPYTKSPMSALHRAASILCALVLLHFFLSCPSPPSEREIRRDRSQPRKLLQPLAAATVNLKGSLGALTKQTVVEASASLRRLPPSKSNPSQNKERNWNGKRRGKEFSSSDFAVRLF